MPKRILRRLQRATQVLITGKQQAAKEIDVPKISSADIAEIKSFFPLEKFFIFGHARSGTTLLARLVRIHRQVHCNWQAHFFTRPPLLQSLVANPATHEWLTRRSNRWNRGADLSPIVLRAAADYILERDARKAGKGDTGCVVGDKSPNSLLDGEAVRLMAKIYPDARLVYIVRDGRDVVVSHRFQLFIDRAGHLSPEDARIRAAFIQHPELFLSGQRSIFTAKGLHDAAVRWARNVWETNEVGQKYFGKRFYSLRYEDLLNQPSEEMSKLWQFLGVPGEYPGLASELRNELQQNPDATWQEQKNAAIAQALTKGKRGTWRELFTARDREIFKEAVADTLVEWQYEHDSDW